MALIKCSECGTEISDQAAACVKCGAPMSVASGGRQPTRKVAAAPAKKRSGCLTVIIGFLFIIVVLAIVGSFSGRGGSDKANPTSSAASADPGAASSATPAPADAEVPAPYGKHAGKSCAKDDLTCRGEAGYIAASVYCKDPIERLGKHAVRWTDGTFETKMSRYRWTGDSHETITYVGDKAEFQNGFGAWTPVVYSCEMGNDGKTVLDVEAHEGRLPN